MEISKKLLLTAIKILESANFHYTEWAVGGGSVLSQKYNHRASKDIDIFIDDVQKITAISPRLNDVSDNALDYTEMNNYISLTFNEGRIDFIVSPQISNFEPEEINFFGHKVRLENPVEIIAKKIFYRGDRVVARDIFDLALVYNSLQKSELLDFLVTISDKMKIFEECLSRMSEENFYGANKNSSVLSGGINLVGKDKEICLQLLEDLHKMRSWR